jgi:hypothetical protein
MMMGGMRSMMKGMAGYGGMYGQMQNQMMQMQGAMSRSGRMFGMGAMMAGGGAGPDTTRKGTDVRSKDRAKARTEQEKALSKSQGPSLFDPYFDIVQVTVYGQARFFNPPPEEPAAQPSPGETAASSPAGAAAADATSASAPSPGAAGSQAKPAAQPESAAASKPAGSTADAGKSSAAPGAAKTEESPSAPKR